MILTFESPFPAAPAPELELVPPILGRPFAYPAASLFVKNVRVIGCASWRDCLVAEGIACKYRHFAFANARNRALHGSVPRCLAARGCCPSLGRLHQEKSQPPDDRLPPPEDWLELSLISAARTA